MMKLNLKHLYIYIYIYEKLRSHLKSITHPATLLALLTLFIFSLSCTSSLKVRTAMRSQGASSDFKIVNVNAESLDQSTLSTNISWTNPSSKASYIEIVFTNDAACEKEIVGSLTVKPQLQEIKNIKANQFRYVCLFALDSKNQRIAAAQNNPYEIKTPEPTSSATPEPTASPDVTVSPSNSPSPSPSATPTVSPSPSPSPPNVAPSFTFVEPKGDNDIIAKNATFNITWTDSDPDNDAAISLYYKATASGACSTGTLITSGISEDANGNNGSYSWNTNGITPGTYYVCASIDDSVNPAVEVWSDSLYINTPPTFTWVTPVAAGTSGSLPQVVTLSWTDSDPDNDATISFYFKQNGNTGACTTGTLITSGISEDDATNTFDWDRSTAISQYYYICARISDGVNANVDVWSPRYHVYRECVWTGATNNTWSTATNWNNCNSGAPTNYDKVVVPSGGTPIVTANTTIHNFEGPAIGGGVVTVNSGITLSFNQGDNKISSDVSFQGATATCTNCIVTTAYGSFGILNNATLTLLSGINLRTNGALKVGDGNSAGHFVVNQGGQPSNEWPLVARVNNSGFALSVNGTIIQNSSISLNGVKFGVVTPGGTVQALNYHFVDFQPYSTITNFDNIDFTNMYPSTFYSAGHGIAFPTSCNLVSINDTNWENINFGPTVFTIDGTNLKVINIPANCGTNITLTNPTGASAGALFASDPGGLLTWPTRTQQTCVWNGVTSTNWNDASNWSSCSARSGVPDLFDYVEIPAGTTFSPTLSTNQGVYRFTGTGTSGGTLTIAANTNLLFAELGGTFSGNVILQGDTSTCSTCKSYVRSGFTIKDNATLTLKPGIMLHPTDYHNRVTVGLGGTGGHLRAEGGATAAEYPIIAGRGQMYINGANGSLSSIYIDGITAGSGSNNTTLTLNSYYEVKKLDRFRTGHNHNANGFSIISMANCANALFSATTWNNMDWFGVPGASSQNFIVSGSGCPNITLTGSGSMYGPSLSVDPLGVLTWN